MMNVDQELALAVLVRRQRSEMLYQNHRVLDYVRHPISF